MSSTVLSEAKTKIKLPAISKISISIFPNPASDYLQISNFEELTISSIEIFDIAGNLISVFASDSTVLDISSFLPGSYFVCFTVGNRKVYRAFIKE